jgi:hypothetical protein
MIIQNEPLRNSIRRQGVKYGQGRTADLPPMMSRGTSRRDRGTSSDHLKKIRPRITPRPDPIRRGVHPTAAISVHTATTIAAVKRRLNLNRGPAPKLQLKHVRRLDLPTPWRESARNFKLTTKAALVAVSNLPLTAAGFAFILRPGCTGCTALLNFVTDRVSGSARNMFH